jgi:ABC-type multidrug transport system fused ATPase/permease subunit
MDSEELCRTPCQDITGEIVMAEFDRARAQPASRPGDSLLRTWQMAISLLDGKQRRQAAGLLATMCITMLLETVSVAMLMPVIMIATYGAHAGELPGVPRSFRGFVQYVCGPTHAAQVANAPSQDAFPQLPAVLAVLGILVVVYTLRTGSVVVQTMQLSNYTFSLQHSVASRLYRHYLTQPYHFHLARNSAHLLRNVLNETHHFAVSYVTAFLNVIADSMVFAGIVGLLLYIAPGVTVVTVALLGGAAASVGGLTRSRLLAWGKERLAREARQHQYAQQGLSAVKDVILHDKSQAFLDYYANENERLCQIYKRQQVVAQLPRVAIEWLAVASLAIAIILLNLAGTPAEIIIPTVGVMAAAAFRLMPTLTRLVHGLQTLRYNRSVVEILHRELPETRVATPIGAGTDGAVDRSSRTFIELRDVHYHYPGHPDPVLQGISMTVDPGTTVGIIGPSGAGKSTLVDVMLGLLTPTTGTVLIDGRNLRSCTVEWQRMLSYVQQSIYLTDDTLRNNIAFGEGSGSIDENRIQRSLEIAQLDGFVRSLPDGLETRVGERGVRLSGGQRQRIGIARAMYREPSVLVLDEATSNLDVETERELMRAIERLKGTMTIVIIAHRLSTVAGCDRVFTLDQGQIVAQGNPATVIPDLARAESACLHEPKTSRSNLA